MLSALNVGAPLYTSAATHVFGLDHVISAALQGAAPASARERSRMTMPQREPLDAGSKGTHRRSIPTVSAPL